MSKFSKKYDTSLDGVLIATMPSWWPIATAVGIYMLYSMF